MNPRTFARQLLEIAPVGPEEEGDWEGSDKDNSEQATGIAQNPHGLGKYFADENTVLTPKQAYERLRTGEGDVEVPNAGAGSYKEFFRSLGFTEVEVWDWSSSAGDWTFVVKDGQGGDWYVAYQINRYPRYGMSYSLDPQWSSESKAELFAILQAY